MDAQRIAVISKRFTIHRQFGVVRQCGNLPSEVAAAMVMTTVATKEVEDTTTITEKITIMVIAADTAKTMVKVVIAQITSKEIMVMTGKPSMLWIIRALMLAPIQLHRAALRETVVGHRPQEQPGVSDIVEHVRLFWGERGLGVL